MKSRPSPILDADMAIAAGPILVFSLYLLFAGHNQPGGGFAGGLVAGVVVVMAWVVGGTEPMRRILPIRSSALLGTGLFLASATGFASLFLGGAFLESAAVTVTIPLVGSVKAVSVLIFDIGVYLVVVGMALWLVRALGEEGT